jgi:hypothetical protein
VQESIEILTVIWLILKPEKNARRHIKIIPSIPESEGKII